MPWYMYPLTGAALLLFYYFCGRHIVQAVIYLWRGLRTDARGREEIMREMREASEARRKKLDWLHGRRRIAAEKMRQDQNKT